MHARGSLARSEDIDVLALDQGVAGLDVTCGLDAANRESPQLLLVRADVFLSVATREFRDANRLDHRPESIGLDRKRMVRAGQPVVEREVLLDDRRPERDSSDRPDDRVTAVVRKARGHAEPLAAARG